MLALYDSSRGTLKGALLASENGRRLVRLGLHDDVTWCARESVLHEVAVLHEGAMWPARDLFRL